MPSTQGKPHTHRIWFFKKYSFLDSWNVIIRFNNPKKLIKQKTVTSENVNETVAYIMFHLAIFPGNVRYFEKIIYLRRTGTDDTMPLCRLQNCGICADAHPLAHVFMTRVWATFQPRLPPWLVAFAQSTN